METWRTFFAASLCSCAQAAHTPRASPSGRCSKTNRFRLSSDRIERKQTDRPNGMVLAQTLVVQVNDEQGAAVTGALVEFSGPAEVSFDPASGLTDTTDNSARTSLSRHGSSISLTARTLAKTQKPIDLKIEEIALGYQEQLGFQLDNKYCARCHSSESSPSASPTTTISQSSRTHSPKATRSQDDRRRTHIHHQHVDPRSTNPH